MLLRHADRQGLLLWGILVVVFSVITIWSTQWPSELCIFLALTVSTFLVMLIDKVQASSGGGRISERSLYIMTLLGGSVGMVLAMYTIRHKSRKLSFQMVVWGLVFIQLFLLYQLIDLTSLLPNSNDGLFSL